MRKKNNRPLTLADLVLWPMRSIRHGWFQQAQAVGPDQNHPVVVPIIGLLNPGHPGPPGTILAAARSSLSQLSFLDFILRLEMSAQIR